MILPTTYGDAAFAVLSAADPRQKVRLTAQVARLARQNGLAHRFERAMPDRPGRPAVPALLAPNQMPKRGKAGSPASRIALLHALAHIELNAIDLAWDIIGRFGAAFPAAFAVEWLKVAADEAKHYLLLTRRLRQLGAAYGDLPAHDGLWEACTKTNHDAIARLAVVPMVFEARGLDVTPQLMDRLRTAGDKQSAAVLEIIYRDEIGHVATGTGWFMVACRNAALHPESTFHDMIRTYLRGGLKPPFNHKARISAGLLPQFYTCLATKAFG
jgi:uncharacterized ferritin-like protein (DUF455 family)